jgi:hypothetical protein
VGQGKWLGKYGAGVSGAKIVGIRFIASGIGEHDICIAGGLGSIGIARESKNRCCGL